MIGARLRQPGAARAAAWTIATETESSLKEVNYIQGAVLLILRKRAAAEPVFLDNESNHLARLRFLAAMEHWAKDAHAALD